MLVYAAGTSSFGMSGVNAHMLLGRPASAQASSRVNMHWEYQSFWPGPMLHHLLHPADSQRASSSGMYM